MAATLLQENPGLVIQRCRPPRQSWSASHARSTSHDLTATHMCPQIAVWQIAVAVLLMKANQMFPEGHSGPKAFAQDGTAAKKTNELLENASAGIDKLFEQRGYDPKKPEQLKAKLGYALDRYEATAYLVTGALHLPLLSPPEARTIGKRIANVIGTSGTVGAKLKGLRKRGKAAAPQIEALLHAEANLNLSPPPRVHTAPPPPPPPAPPPAPSAPLLPTDQLCTRATAAAATPLQRLYGMPDPAAWGPDEADMPWEPHPTTPGAPAAARAELGEPWLQSQEAAHAIIAAYELEAAYECLDAGCTEEDGTPIEETIEVAQVRYKHSLRRLQAAVPAAVPELILEPQMANEHNSKPCPFGFGRIVRQPWALHLRSLGFCERECLCGAVSYARDDIVLASGVGWPGLVPGRRMWPVYEPPWL